jgi:membrane peptidoglycan carboxypeptidase
MLRRNRLGHFQGRSRWSRCKTSRFNDQTILFTQPQSSNFWMPMDTIFNALWLGDFLPRNRRLGNSTQIPRNGVTLQSALANSINTVSAKLIDKPTRSRCKVALTHKLGIIQKFQSNHQLHLALLT